MTDLAQLNRIRGLLSMPPQPQQPTLQGLFGSSPAPVGTGGPAQAPAPAPAIPPYQFNTSLDWGLPPAELKRQMDEQAANAMNVRAGASMPPRAGVPSTGGPAQTAATGGGPAQMPMAPPSMLGVEDVLSRWIAGGAKGPLVPEGYSFRLSDGRDLGAVQRAVGINHGPRGR